MHRIALCLTECRALSLNKSKFPFESKRFVWWICARSDNSIQFSPLVSIASMCMHTTQMSTITMRAWATVRQADKQLPPSFITLEARLAVLHQLQAIAICTILICRISADRAPRRCTVLLESACLASLPVAEMEVNVMWCNVISHATAVPWASGNVELVPLERDASLPSRNFWLQSQVSHAPEKLCVIFAVSLVYICSAHAP